MKFMRSKGLFPLLPGSDFDPIAVLIFSYVNIKKRAIPILGRLNSKGYQLTCRESLHGSFVMLNKTPFVCRNDTHHRHGDELSEYTDLEIISIETFEDRYYLKGLTFTYLCDGWRSEVKSYLMTKQDPRELKKRIITFKRGQYLKEIEFCRGRFLQKIRFQRSDGYQIEAGSVNKGDKFLTVIPKGWRARNFQLCTVTDYPFSAIVGFGLNVINPLTHEQQWTSSKDITWPGPPLNLDYHSHFDPMSSHGKNFKRMTEIEFTTVKRTIKVQ